MLSCMFTHEWVDRVKSLVKLVAHGVPCPDTRSRWDQMLCRCCCCCCCCPLPLNRCSLNTLSISYTRGLLYGCHVFHSSDSNSCTSSCIEVLTRSLFYGPCSKLCSHSVDAVLLMTVSVASDMLDHKPLPSAEMLPRCCGVYPWFRTYL